MKNWPFFLVILMLVGSMSLALAARVPPRPVSRPAIRQATPPPAVPRLLPSRKRPEPVTAPQTWWYWLMFTADSRTREEKEQGPIITFNGRLVRWKDGSYVNASELPTGSSYFIDPKTNILELKK